MSRIVTLLLFSISLAAVCHFQSQTGLMYCFSYFFILICVICFTASFSDLFMFPMKLKVKKDLRSMTLDSLKKQVFRYAKDYFQTINEEDFAVKRFRELVETQDIEALVEEWSFLEDRFRDLERKSKSRGGPRLSEHYCWYDLDLHELHNRYLKARAKQQLANSASLNRI